LATFIQLFLSAVQPQKYLLKVLAERCDAKHRELQLPLVVRQQLTKLVVLPVYTLDLLLTVRDLCKQKKTVSKEKTDQQALRECKPPQRQLVVTLSSTCQFPTSDSILFMPLFQTPGMNCWTRRNIQTVDSFKLALKMFLLNSQIPTNNM